ncbi:10276_t:CDS:10 [Cetraspora pellucida]|uniref:10276_t:CDS:1 n=1 Tax=Cetraspora pellucida TaxID=1433469 RepID=A0A9N9NYG5_9GLOM|nr:10276_t:CDS:10 [Cetraspora pellucida]
MIFESKYPDIKIPQTGVYQYVTSNPEQIPDEKPIFIDGVTGKSCTYGEFKHDSKKFAAGLQDKLGGKVTTANPKFIETELLHQLKDSGASVLIVHPEFIDSAIEVSINAGIPSYNIFLFGDNEVKGYKPYRSVLIGDREIEPVTYTPEEAKSTTAYLLYSSGTTGKQKGIELTHTNINVNLAQLLGTDCFLGSQSIMMGILPFCHIFALTAIIHGTFIYSTTSIVLPCFNVKTFCEAIQNYKINYIHGVPPIINKLVDDPVVQDFDLSSVEMIVSGAAPLSDKLVKKFYEMFNIPILQSYGLTEAALVLHYSGTKNSKIAVPGSIGTLIPNVKAKIISEDGHELGYDEPGELYIQGPNVMKGYLNNKEATDAVFDKDGFFITGDIVYVDEQGNFFIVNRKKEFIKYKGYQVAPAELESILLTHEAVSDAAVIGEYYEAEATEIPVAYVTIKNKYEKSQDLAKNIQYYVDEKVASHKKIRGGVLYIDKIPRSDSGKMLRRILRERLKQDRMC